MTAGRFMPILQRSLKPGLVGAGLVGGGALGAALVSLALRFGPLAPVVLLGVVAVPIAGIIGLIDPRIAISLVFVSFLGGTVAVSLDVITLQVPEIGTIAGVALVALHVLGRRETRVVWAGAFWWLVGLIVWSLISMITAVDLELAMKQIAALVGGVLFLVAFVNAAGGAVDVRRIMGALVGIAVLLSMIALLQADRLEASRGASTVQGRAEGLFTQPNQLGSFSALAAGVAIALALGATARRGRWLAVLALVPIMGALLLSLSRGAWVGIALALVYLVVKLPEARRAVIAAAVPLLAIAAVAGAFAPESLQAGVIGERLASVAVLSPYDGRAEIWGEAVHQTQTHPLLGVGPGGFPVASTRAGTAAVFIRPAHAHNILLNWTAETGIPGALLLVGFACAVGFASREAQRAAAARPRDRALVVGLTGGLITVIGQGMVDYTLRLPVILTSILAVCGGVLVVARAGPPSYTSPTVEMTHEQSPTP